MMGAYNATKHVTTGFSPSLLWFGREKRLPLGVLFPKSHSYPLTPKKYLKQMLDQSARNYAMIRNNAQQAQMRQKRNYDKATGFQKPQKQGDAVRRSWQATESLEGTLQDSQSVPRRTLVHTGQWYGDTL